ncbi:MAG: geranylgeranylglyceryl/heptaprenylglyceryl phosphate synthase, partial [Flavobacterium sp. BFFFF2]
MLIERINKQDKCFAALLDPDKADLHAMLEGNHLPDLFFVGGSFVSNHKQDELCRNLKKASDTPVVLFPGDPTHISNHADAILFLSLISGRNAEFLIGKHVIAATMLKRSTLKILPTGYMLIDAGKPTSASYISHTQPIPYDKIDLAVATALAAEMLGMKYIFLDTGSGAQKPVSLEMIQTVSEQVSLPVL